MDEINASTLKSLTKQLTLHEELIQELKSTISALKIDSQFYIKSPKDIVPGYKCKIGFDNNGLVINSGDLIKTDIPDIDITQVNGLSDALAAKATKSETERLSLIIDGLFTNRGTTVGEGTKVTFDANGLITGTGRLSSDDIPSIPISKVENLEDVISSLSTPVEVEEFVHPIVSPSTNVKVTYDKNGHVIHGEELGINDLPRELINRINVIESTLVEMAPKRLVDSLSKQVSELSSQMETYSKVSTERKVQTSIEIADVEGLNETLKDLVKYEDIVELQSEVSTISSLVAGKKATPTETSSVGTWSQKFEEIKRDIDEVDERVSRIYDSVPIDKVMSEFERISGMIQNLSDRVLDLEKKMR